MECKKKEEPKPFVQPPQNSFACYYCWKTFSQKPTLAMHIKELCKIAPKSIDNIEKSSEKSTKEKMDFQKKIYNGSTIEIVPVKGMFIRLLQIIHY